MPTLLDFINRSLVPEAWAEGDNIPWNDPGFSERMLREHLTQDHDAASRRTEKIERHVAWIHRHVLSGQPARILDLGCGPGLYTSRLERLGHSCVGIDFSPASIRYAKEQAALERLSCAYLCEDVRQAVFGSGYGLVMLIFGEFNVFKPADARVILEKSRAALAPDGLLLLETSTFDGIYKIGHQPATWYTSSGSLFSPVPHVALTECSWDTGGSTATTRYFIVDAASAEVNRYTSTYQAYTVETLTALLIECGFNDVCFYPSLCGAVDETQSDFMAVVAHKR